MSSAVVAVGRLEDRAGLLVRRGEDRVTTIPLKKTKSVGWGGALVGGEGDPCAAVPVKTSRALVDRECSILLPAVGRS